MADAGRMLLETAATLIVAGGAYDLFAPRLPENLNKLCGESGSARVLARELLRALGGALVAVGAAVFMLAASAPTPIPLPTLILIVILVTPAEGVNALCMWRVGSPFYIPLIFPALTLAGVGLQWAHALR